MSLSTPRRSQRLPPAPALQLQEHAAGIRYRQLPSEAVTLFGSSGPRAAHVQQGHVGDCWLMAALAALAHARPQLICNMVRPTAAANVYEVCLFVPTDFGLQPRWLRVDTRIATDRDGSSSYAALPVDRRSRKRVLWVALIEKACAQVFRDDAFASYQGLDGNDARWAFAVLTGCGTSLEDPAQMSRQDLVECLANTSPQACVLVGSKTRAKGLLAADHYFTVLRASGNQITLRDPHGAPKGGEITLSLAELREACDVLSITEL